MAPSCDLGRMFLSCGSKKVDKGRSVGGWACALHMTAALGIQVIQHGGAAAASSGHKGAVPRQGRGPSALGVNDWGVIHAGAGVSHGGA